MQINDITYKLPSENYVSEEFVKKQIIIGHTFNHNMRHVVGWRHRYNGIYKKTAAYTISKNGDIFKHFEPKYHSRYFNNLELDRKTIVILLENDGWLLKDSQNSQFITWIGDIYKQPSPIIEKRWRGYDHWEPYTLEQLESATNLAKELCEEFNIPVSAISHNTRVEGVDNFSGVLYKSNLDKHFTDVSPAWPCDTFKNKLELK
jgi:N-acetyl-anhydromuramyl-L-alanine amidase AmpD